jgi:hypothetical protein
MDFIVVLPLSALKYYSIWVIVDRFTKSAHLVLVHKNYRAGMYVEFYLARILCLLGVPKIIISDRGPQFIAHFWEQLHVFLGTHMIHSSTYHLQTNGQTERVKKVLEDMLRACMLNYQDKWDKCLSLTDFSYNISYQESLKMEPFEALYSCRCRTPLNWIRPGERKFFGHDLFTEAEEIVHHIQSNLKVAKSLQERDANKRHRPLEFQVLDRM